LAGTVRQYTIVTIIIIFLLPAALIVVTRIIRIAVRRLPRFLTARRS
jgi:hypothetical protein